MPTLAEVRQRYPQYADMPDDQLAGALHQKFYSDMPFEDFSKRIGYKPPTNEQLNARDGLPADYPRHSPTESTGDWWGKELKAMTYPQTWGRQAKLAGRNIVDAVESLPMTAMDMGVSARNMLTGSNYDLPSQMNRQALNTVLPESRTPQEKIAGVVESALAGSRLPAPQAAQQAPSGFVKPGYDMVRQQTLANAQKAGYVVPPATTNPTLGNKLMESLGGKMATAQDAAVRNQDVTNTLAKRALGLSEDAPLTQDALTSLRSEAGDAYKTLRQVGSVALDAPATQTLDSVAAKFAGSKLKDALGDGNNIPKIVQALKDEPLNGNSAVDAIDILRGSANKAYLAGDKELGKGYREVSSAIENLMERNLSGDALQQFKDARQLIAKSYSVESAFNPSTGNVVATKLAAQLAKNKPLSGDLKLAAQFGQAFPKAAQGITDSGAVRNTDVLMSAGASALSKEPGWLLYPFARQAARSFLLSGPGQQLAKQGASSGIPPEVVLAALIAAEKARQTANSPPVGK